MKITLSAKAKCQIVRFENNFKDVVDLNFRRLERRFETFETLATSESNVTIVKGCLQCARRWRFFTFCVTL